MSDQTATTSSDRFQVIAVDPPWSYGSAASAGKPGSAEAQYVTIGSSVGTEVNRRTGAGIENIAAAVPMDDIAAPDSALFLWATNPKLPFAFDLMEMWGFTYKTTLTWVKVTKDREVLRGGLGWFFRGATEHVLFGTRGRYGIPANLRQPNVVLASRSRHSAKPDEFYDLVVAATPGQHRLDCFARTWRDGWWSWGNEVEDAPDSGSHPAPGEAP